MKFLIDGVIEGKVQEKDIENIIKNQNQKIIKAKSVNKSKECKRHPCEKCEKTFSTLQGLNLHIGHVHKIDMIHNL